MQADPQPNCQQKAISSPVWGRDLPKLFLDSNITLGIKNPNMACFQVTNEVNSPRASSSINEADYESSVEEEIVTAGARAKLNSSQPDLRAPIPYIYYEGHEDSGGEDSSKEESLESQSEGSELELVEDTKPRQIGFPLVEELPDWFPENINQIYRVDRHGGSLSYKARCSQLSNIIANRIQELDEITRYRAALEIIYRRKWRKYIEAGRARWQLQQAIHHLKCRPLTKAFYNYRKEQFKTWKATGLRLWKRLEKTHRGILILDGTININFRQERVIHEKNLEGRM
jgi:hypothetical protein